MTKLFKGVSLLVLVAMLFGAVSSVIAAEDTIVVGFSQIGAESEWRTANTESIKSAAAADPRIELKFSDAQQKQQNQIKAIRSFIAQDVDLISFSPVVTTGWTTVLKEAKDAGIPVLLIDRKVDADKSLYVTLIGSDFELEGKKAAAWMAYYMNGKANIAELQGTVGSAAAVERKKGFKQIIQHFPAMEIIASQSGDFTRSGGKEVMESFLKAEGDNIDAIFSHNDDMAIGAIQAIEEYGMEPGKDIVILGVDGVKGAFEAMIQGKMNCTVECNPLLGPQMMDVVKGIIDGKEYPKYIPSEEAIYTQDQAKEAYPNRKY